MMKNNKSIRIFEGATAIVTGGNSSGGIIVYSLIEQCSLLKKSLMSKIKIS